MEKQNCQRSEITTYFNIISSLWKLSIIDNFYKGVRSRCYGWLLHKNTSELTIINDKIYCYIGNGVEIINAVTGERRFFHNNWYTDERLEQLLGLSNKTKIKSR